ncbi:MAG: hypothetical protein UU77_C0021G0010 [candidate division WWE3 bacterium GW2011_GWC1_41_7]|uniref:Uncharacterized protein n=4 Tax=Katanobacteria TaxID=422282 RepID=A0A0G0X8D4_UNCKA|nr:MAG: hypothetical protein UU72_C0001G0086 [candidate division WWE3 bacterium GW2011_GWB1_41_6]KKS20652.1 MAG: hypothetical protein UU77_C0021G0010 [candidate division WWE3 bacterium GW2011_GWC1_41_7]KKS22863.1 MAG: hypothetical protein UU80_C0001G0028 [candidate division WWE3 bacterium GW2011_GWA1_41_8]OGC56530.1 MAG: hypothetical protein A2976_02940 [candidate division WWE3 bacterium RIFCSPLOWO2_01_FULL_41_9]
MNRFYVVIALLLLIFSIVFYFKQKNNIAINPAKTFVEINESGTEYMNEKLGFKFRYSENFVMKEYDFEDELYLGLGETDTKMPILIRGVYYGVSEADGGFLDIINQDCLASGPSTETYCELMMSEPFKNTEGLAGKKMYFRYIHLGEDAINVQFGPFYFLDIGNNKANVPTLMIGPSDFAVNSDGAGVYEDIITSVANSVSLIK